MKSIRKLIGTDVVDNETTLIGTVDDALISKKDLVIRYLLVPNPRDRGKSTEIPISPALVKNHPRVHNSKPLILRFSKQFIIDGPDTNTAAEEEIYKYYNCTPYWEGPKLWGRGEFPEQLFLEEYSHEDMNTDSDWFKHYFNAKGKKRGIKDYIFDERAWEIQYLVSKTGRLLAPGKAFKNIYKK